MRSNYSVTLTDEGMLFRKRAEDIWDMVDKTKEEFKSLNEITGGDVRIGCAESLQRFPLSDISDKEGECLQIFFPCSTRLAQRQTTSMEGRDTVVVGARTQQY